MLDLADLEIGGFFDLEHNLGGPFRWTKKRFILAVPPGDFRFVTLEFANKVHQNSLRIDSGSGSQHHALLVGWQTLDVVLNGLQLHFEVTIPFRAEGDGRELGLMLRSALFHTDAESHQLLKTRRDNLLLNDREFSSGSEYLHSVPPYLQINMSKVCNIANEAVCVYCAWDWAKKLEQGSPDMSPAFFEKLGRFGRLAASVGDCSVGEPPMEREFEDLLNAVTEGGRTFSFTSNGQTLSAKKRRAMLGKPVLLYVSLNSATSEGYARYRDQRFNLVVENLRALCQEKRAHDKLPKLVVSFIVMRSNRNECGIFLELMKDIGVDGVKFRALTVDEPVSEPVSRRGGHVFDYDRECLAADELSAIAAEINGMKSRYSFDVIIEWQAFLASQPPPDANKPICNEPWKASYVLARGIMPCCYGRAPIATWDEIDQDDLGGGLERIFNNEAYRELRRSLAKGVLPRYCLESHACPLTKNHIATQAVRPEESS